MKPDYPTSPPPPSTNIISSNIAKLAAIVKAHGKVNTELRVLFQVLEDQMVGIARITGSETSASINQVACRSQQWVIVNGFRAQVSASKGIAGYLVAAM